MADFEDGDENEMVPLNNKDTTQQANNNGNTREPNGAKGGEADGVDDGLSNDAASATADVMAVPITLGERLHGLPLYLIAFAFFTAAVLSVAGVGLHAYTLYESTRSRSITRCVSSLQEARDQIVLARFAAGVLMSYAPGHVRSDVAAMVDRPDLFLSLLKPSAALPAESVHLYAKDGAPIVADGTLAQRRFLELSRTVNALNSAVDDATSSLSGGISTSTIATIRTAANAALVQALARVRAYHTTPASVSSADVTSLLAQLDKCAEAMGRDAVSSVLSEMPQKWTLRLPLLQMLHAQFTRVAYAVDALRIATLSADDRGVLLTTQPSTASIAFDVASVLSVGVVGGPIANSLPYSTSNGVADPRSVDTLATGAEYSSRSQRTLSGLAADASTVLNNASSNLLVGALNAGATPSPSFAPVFSAIDAAAVDTTYHNQVWAAIKARRAESWAMVQDADSRFAQAIVALVFLALASVTSSVGLAISWGYAQASVFRRAAYQRLVERHRAIEDLSALKGMHAEVASMHVPGWEEYNQLRRTGTNADVADAGVKLTRSVNGAAARYRQKSLSIAADIRDPDLVQLGTSIRPKMLDRLRSTNTTAAKLGASIAMGASQRSHGGGDASASSDNVAPAKSAVYVVTRSLTAFAAKLSGAVARLRAHAPQACFGDVEGDSAAVTAGGSGAKTNGANGVNGLAVSGRQMITDIRTRELRHDRALHLCYCTVMLMDASALIPEPEAMTFSDLAAAGFETGSAMVRPAFVAMDRFLALFEEVVNGQDGLILGVNGDEVGAIWNLVGQTSLHHTRAVCAAFALRNGMKVASVTALEEAETAAQRLTKAQLNLSTAQVQNGGKNKIKRLERTVQELQQRVVALKASAKWFKSRNGGIAIASSALSAGTVAALVNAQTVTSANSQKSGEGTAAAGIIDRSARSLDDAAVKAANDKRQTTRRTGKAAQNALAQSLSSLSAPRWFEAVGPAFGLCHKMLRLNARLGTEVLVTEEVCDAAHNASLNGATLDAEAATQIDTASGAQPALVRRPVATLFQVNLGADEGLFNTALSGGNPNRRAEGGMQSVSNAPGGKRSSDGRVMSNAGGKTVAGTWTNVYSIFVGFENDARASPEQWDACFEDLSRHLRKGNQPAALKGLREYVDGLASAMGGGVAAAQASMRPGAGSARPLQARRMPTDNDRVIKAWMEDLLAYESDLGHSTSAAK